MPRCVGTLGVILMTVGGEATAQPRSLEGVWGVQVTLRLCSNNAPLGSFFSIVTFAPGGTIIESSGSLAFAPGQRSIGYGRWTHLGGNTNSQRVLGMILFDSAPNPPVSPGFFAGWQTIDQTVDLSEPNRFTSTGTSGLFRFDLTQYRTGCATAVGHLFQ